MKTEAEIRVERDKYMAELAQTQHALEVARRLVNQHAINIQRLEGGIAMLNLILGDGPPLAWFSTLTLDRAARRRFKAKQANWRAIHERQAAQAAVKA